MGENSHTGVYTSFNELLEMQKYANAFHLRGSNQKVKSIMGGRFASSLRGRGMDFEEVRKYVPGDDIRHIDWKVTARTKTTHAKVFTEEKEKPVLLVLDQSSSMFFGTSYKTKAVIAAEIAALLAFKVQKEGDRFGVLCLGDEHSQMLPPKRGMDNVLAALQLMVKFNNDLQAKTVNYNKKNMDHAINQLFHIITHDYLVVIVSDFIHYSSQAIQSIVRVKQHNDALVIKVYDPMEKDIFPKNFITSNGVYQNVVRGVDRKIRHKFNEGYTQRLQDFEAEMNRHRIPVVSFSTEKDIDAQLHDKFL